MRKPRGEVWLISLFGLGAACSAFGSSSSSDPSTGALAPLPCGANGCAGNDICCWVNAAAGTASASYACMPTQKCASASENVLITCDGDARCAAFGPDEHCCGHARDPDFFGGTHCVKTKCPDGELSVCPLGQKPDPCVAPDSCMQTIVPTGYGICFH